MSWEVRQGDALARLREMPDESVHCCVTSPPYFGLRDYGVEGQIGLEPTLDEYLARLVDVFAEARRVLRSDGTLWLNLGDRYIDGCLVGAPWKVAFALIEEGWLLRAENIWAKGLDGQAGMPYSGKGRTTRSHEQLFHFSASERYFYDHEAIKEAATYTGPNGAQHSPYAQGFKRRSDKQRESAEAGPAATARTKAGFNDRWKGSSLLDRMERSSRSQTRRAAEIARESSLRPEHLAAIRSVGIADTGKAITTQTGAGRNTAEVEELAAEAKRALGGYYREFLIPDRRNKRSVWNISTSSFGGAHFAVMPVGLAEPCILAGCPEGGTVLDPFAGASTTGVVATRLNRSYIGIELNAEYVEMGRRRIRDDAPLLNTPIEAAS